MTATNCADLIAITEKEYAKLARLIADIPTESALIKDADETSIKDVIAHRAHWIDLFLGWYRDGLAGKDVHFPAKGYKWNQLKAYNAALRDAQKDLSWEDAKTDLEKRFQTLLGFINAHTDADLYSGPMQGANNNWTPGRWAEAAGPSHFRSAAKYIRQRLKAVATKN